MVTVALRVIICPYTDGVMLLVSEVIVSASIVSVIAVEVDPRKLVSPPYTAVSAWFPSDWNEKVRVATPATSGDDPRKVPPS